MTTNPTVQSTPEAGASQSVAAESVNWATMSHLSAFVMFLGIPALVGPLVIWLLKRDDPFVVAHAKEAVNFNISYLIYGVVAAISIVLLVGIVLLPIVGIAWFALVIVAAIQTSSGEDYRYPFTLRLVN